MVHLSDPKRADLLACDMQNGLVMALSPWQPAPAWRVLARLDHPAHAELKMTAARLASVSLNRFAASPEISLGRLQPSASARAIMWRRSPSGATVVSARAHWT